MWADPAVRTQIDKAVEEAAAALIVNLTNALSNSPVKDYAAISNVQPIPIPQESEEPEVQEFNLPIIKNQQEQVQEDPATWGS